MARILKKRPFTGLVKAGVARTFQHVELFSSMTLLENIMVGMHVRTKAGFWAAVTRLPAMKREERQSRRRAEELLEFTGLSADAHKEAGDLPVGRQKTAQIARHWLLSPFFCCLTNRRPD